MILKNQVDPLNLKSFGFHLALFYFFLAIFLNFSHKANLKCSLKLTKLVG